MHFTFHGISKCYKTKHKINNNTHFGIKNKNEKQNNIKGNYKHLKSRWEDKRGIYQLQGKAFRNRKTRPSCPSRDL